MTEGTLRFVAAHGLPGERPRPAPITGTTVDALIRAAALENLIGLLDQAVADGAVQADAEAADRIGEAAVRVQAWTLLVERHHLEVHQLLADAGLDARFLKGPAIAHRFYDHPALRPFVDVDVLVHGADLDRAIGQVMAQGHTRNQPELIAGFSARYGKSVTLRSPGGIEVDLHRTLAAGPYGLVRRPDALWERPAHAVEIGGVSLPVLDPTAAFVHAAIHAVTGRRARLGSLRDLAQMAGCAGGSADLADTLRVVACLARGAQRATTELDIRGPSALDELAARPISRRDRRWLAGYEANRSYGWSARASVLALPGPLHKARYATALIRAGLRRRSWPVVPRSPRVGNVGTSDLGRGNQGR